MNKQILKRLYTFSSLSSSQQHIQHTIIIKNYFSILSSNSLTTKSIPFITSSSLQNKILYNFSTSKDDSQKTTQEDETIKFYQKKYQNDPNPNPKETQQNNFKMNQDRIFNKQRPIKNQFFDQNSDYFTVLGIQSNASEQQIKFAYLQRVKKYHPDLSKQSDASAKFQLIQKAYQVLSEPSSRSTYKADIKISDPTIYDRAQALRDKLKNYSRKDQVQDQFQFSYKLYKRHYQQIEVKKKQYNYYEGDGNEYWMHKSELEPTKKVRYDQISMIVGSVLIIGASFGYLWLL